MGRSSKNDVYQLTFILNLLLIPFGILILLTGMATLNNIHLYEEFLKGMFENLSLCLMMAGLLSIIVALFGCYGVLRDRFCIIMIYPHVLLLIFAFQIVVAGLAFVQKDGKQEILDRKFDESIHNYSTWHLEKMDVIQSELKCCGFNSSGDYYSDVPLSCCDNNNCSISISYYEKGCKIALENLIESQGNIIIGVSITFAAFQISGFVYFLYCCRRMMLDKPRHSSTRSLIQEESSDEETTHYP